MKYDVTLRIYRQDDYEVKNIEAGSKDEAIDEAIRLYQNDDLEPHKGRVVEAIVKERSVEHG